MHIIEKAQRKQSKLRIGLSAPSKAGKTYSSLRLAKGLAGGDMTKVGMIDSENGRGALYSHLGEYNIIKLKPPFTPESYIEAIHDLENAGMEVIIIDSTTHEWEGEGGCLQLNEKLAIGKFKGNTWSAWSETTPRHQRFLDAITSSSCHIITTVRNKIETVMTDDKKVKKVGVKEIQREGFEYELTTNMNIDRDTHLVVPGSELIDMLGLKTQDPILITEEIGEKLRDWVLSGAVDTEEEEKDKLKSQINMLVIAVSKDMQWLEEQKGSINLMTIAELQTTKTQLEAALERFNAKKTANDALKTSAAKHINTTK